MNESSSEQAVVSNVTNKPVNGLLVVVVCWMLNLVNRVKKQSGEAFFNSSFRTLKR